jgi:hypothetical protein
MRENLQAEATYLWTLLKILKMKLEMLFLGALKESSWGLLKRQRGNKVMSKKSLILANSQSKT